MRKLLVIFTAIVLAFAFALGDQVIRLSQSGNPLGVEQIKSFFGLGADPSPGRPQIPSAPSTPEPDPEPNLSYDERLEKGDYYYDRGFVNFAINEYVKAANLEPRRSEPYLKLAQAHFDLLDYEKSEKNASQALSLNSQDFSAQYFLVLIAIKQNDFVKAQELINQLQSSGITDARLVYYQGLLKAVSDQHEDAKEILSSIQQNPSATVDLRAKAGAILSGYEEFEFAEAAEALYLGELLSRAFNEVGEYELAIFKLKEILKARSDLRDAWILLGFSYLNLEKYVFALTAFESAYELDPQWPATQYFLGITYAELERNDDAIVYLNYAANNGFEPQQVIKQKLADLYLDTQNYVESVRVYEELLTQQSNDVEAFVRPIWIYLDFLKQPEKALKLAEQAVTKFPNEPMSYNLLGWSQTETRNYTEAEKNLNKALQANPQFSAAYYNLGKLYEKLNQKESALFAYQKAYEHDQNGSIGNLAAKRYNALFIE